MSNLTLKVENYKLVKTEVSEVAELLKKIYINKEACYIRALSKSSGRYKTYPINSMKESLKLNKILNANIFDRVDLMLSLNPFKTMEKATKNNLFCINAIAVDVDYKKIKEFKELDPKQIIELLELDFFESRIPTPSLIEYGNQVRLIYLVETCYIPKFKKDVVVLAERISTVFAEELKGYGAEEQSLESYFRVPYSINSKNNSKVKMYMYENTIRYTLNELQELWLDELPKWYPSFKKKKKGRRKATNNITKLHNVYSLNCNRLRDFEKYQEYLNSIGECDLRARLCFQYRNYTLIKIKYQNGKLTKEDFEFAKNEMLKFNDKFNYPLRENVIESLTRSVNKTQYLYKNETLIDFLELNYKLCEVIGLESIYKVKSKEDRNKDYYNKSNSILLEKKKEKYVKKDTKKQEILKQKKRIKNLREKGLKNKDIASRLKLGKSTVERYITEMKKEGVLD
ncbi:MAG: helix-turn-helix domain-containing protein [Clostridium sp.]